MTIEWLAVAVYVCVGVSGFLLGTFLFRWLMKLYKWLKLTRELKERYSEMYEILEETIDEPSEDETSEEQKLANPFLGGGKND